MQMVEVLLGHSSTKLPKPQDNGHTHKWTIFVKPANRKYEDFPDTKLIQKVKFEIHQTYSQPIRVVTKPPFRISETGFASFTTVVTIYLNLPNEMERKIPYELKLFTGEHDVQSEVQRLALKHEAPAWYLEQMKMYEKPKKRKASMLSSSNDEKSPQEPKKHQKEKWTPVKDDHEKYKSDKDSSKNKKPKDNGIPRIEIEKSSDSPRRKDKKEKKCEQEARPEEKVEKVKSPEELTKRLNECSDSYVIYKASEFLLTLPDTKLSSSTLQLTFDLSKCNSDTLLEIGRILKLKKSK